MPGDLPKNCMVPTMHFFLSVSLGRKSSVQLHAEKPTLRDMFVKWGA